MTGGAFSCGGEGEFDVKILIFSVQCPRSLAGDNTFSQLFSSFRPEQLATVYIREELPDDPHCATYFQVSEQKVLRSLLHPRTETGRIVTPQTVPTEEDRAAGEAAHALYVRGRQARTYHFRQCLREVAWWLGHWHTQAWDSFLDDFHPDVIVFDMSNYAHLTRMVRDAIRRTGAAAVGFLWDDTFTYRQGLRSPGFLLWRWGNRLALRRVSRLCGAFCAISQKTKQEADAFFGIDCRIVTKPIRYAPGETFCPTVPHRPLRLLYTGNLLVGRLGTLFLLAETLRELQADGRPRVVADVYTATPLTEADRDRLSPFVTVHAAIPQPQVLEKQGEADVLLLLEALTPPESQISRLSFSTKITDYLHAGKCILAVGPSDVASMEYLRGEDAALCVYDQEGMGQALRRLLEDTNLLSAYGERAYACGRRNHAGELMDKRLFEVLDTALADRDRKKSHGGKGRRSRRRCRS